MNKVEFKNIQDGATMSFSEFKISGDPDDRLFVDFELNVQCDNFQVKKTIYAEIVDFYSFIIESEKFVRKGWSTFYFDPPSPFTIKFDSYQETCVKLFVSITNGAAYGYLEFTFVIYKNDLLKISEQLKSILSPYL